MKRLLLLSLLLSISNVLNAQGWGEIQKIVPDDRFSGQQFGAAVAIDGNYAVVGVLASNSARDAYVFENDGNGNWVQLQKLQSPNFNQFDHFGSAVAISGDYIFVGAWGQSYDASEAEFLTSAGAAYIFKKEVSGLFEWKQKIVASDRKALNAFGWRIAVDGDYAIVSPVRHDYEVSETNSLDDAGTAYIFENDGSGTWNEVQKIVSTDIAAFDYFARDGISISGDYAVVSARFEDEDAEGTNTISSAGSAYVFERDMNGVWNEDQKIVASDREQGEQFGASVDVSGNTIVVGTENEYLTGNTGAQYGAAYVFKRDTSGEWNETQKLAASDGATNDRFGQSVSIDGNHVIVGAYSKNYTVGGTTFPGGGSAYVFEYNGAGTWNEIQNIYALDRAQSDSFGYSVAISGDYAIVGAYQEDEDENGLNTLTSAGSAYFFDANEPSTLSVLENNFESTIKAYPNPVKNVLHLNLGSYFDAVEVTIHNVLGQQVFSENYRNSNSIQLELNQPKGMYLVEVKVYGEATSVLKIVKH